MSNLWAAALCAAGLWLICTAAVIYEFPKRPTGEAWVVTASDKSPSQPMLVRAAVPFKVARQLP